MRLRNVSYAKEKIENSSYVIKNPESYYKKFQTVFEKKQPIFLEIGTGKGHFIIEQAKHNPNINFIGLEKYDSVLVRAIESLENVDLPNLRFIRIDAVEIEKIFDHEISMLYLNFSDPWPKNRHEHRRLTSPVFLKRYDSIFKNEKIVEMKTDNRKLFEYSLISFTEYGYHIKELSLDLYQDDKKDNIPTEYEKKFHEKGFPIYYLKSFK